MLSALLTFGLSAAAVALPATAARAVEPPRVRVTPGTSGVVLGSTRALTATVTGLTDTTVTWSVRRGPGSIDADGVYSPPALLPPDPVAVVRAASTADPTLYGEAVVTIASGVPANGFAPHVAVTGGAYKTRAGDVTGDGIADVVRMQGLANDIKTFQFVTMSSNGSGGFTESTSPVGSVYTKPDGFTQTTDYVGDFEIADVEGDGDNDLVIAFGSSGTQTYRYQVFRNNGTGTWTPDAKVLADSGARSGATMKLVDFDGDGHLDMVRLDMLASVVLQKGDGTGAFAPSVPLFSASGGRYLDVGDLTGDGRPEVVVGTQTSTFVVERAYKVAVNDGFGNIAGETTYTVGLNPDPFVYDLNGDGWNDLVVAIGGDGATNDPPKLMAQLNLGTGTGAVGAATQLFAFRPTDLQAVHVDGDGVLDLAGATFRGPFFARRTGPGTFSPVHSGSPFSISATATADVTGDGRLDVYGAQERESRFWAGSDDGTFSFAIDSGPAYLNASHTGVFTAAVRNSSAPVQVQFTASRGTFASSFFLSSSATYTAPSGASSAGTPVRITATIAAIPVSTTLDIVVVNDSYQQFALGGQQVRHVVPDPVDPQTLYVTTGTGVYRSLNNGTTFGAIGTTSVTGSDARQIAVVRSGDTARLLAIFATTLYRYDLAAGGDWTAVGLGSAASVSAVPSSLVAYAASGGQVHRTTDAGLTWAPLGGAQVQEVDAIDADRVWVRRTSTPRVNVGTVVDGVMTLAAREIPGGFASSITPRPTDRATAYVTTSDPPYRLYRGDAATGTWTALTSAGFVDAVSESPVTGHLLATRYNTTTLVKSRDGGASWYSAYRGFPNGVSLLAVAHRTDGVDVVGTTSGEYLPVATTPPATPEITSGPTGTTGPGGANAFSFAFTGTGTSYLCALDNANWSACTSPKTYNGPLSSGAHTFSVVAVVNGDESVPASRAWTVDATPPPPVTGLTGPPALSNQTTATFTWTTPEGATDVTCSLDGATPVSCVSGVQRTGLAQGARTFAVRTVDEYGNASAPVTHAWTVDTVPPQYPHFWTVPAYRTAETWGYFQWQHDATATYTCTLDGQPIGCGSGNKAVSGLAEGPHVFSVVATDGAGNTTDNSYGWEVDLTPPGAPTITVKPPVSTEATGAYFEFTSADADVYYYWCAVDGDTQGCYGTFTAAGLTPGTHTFTVFAIDQAGHAGPVTTYTWTIDPPAPPGAPTITGGPTGLVTTKTAAFTYDVGSGNTATCSLDGAEATTCPTSGITYANLADGPHTFAVHAVRNGVPSAAATRAWTVDTTPPGMPALTAAPAARTKATTATFAWTPVDGLVYTCLLDTVAVACGDGSYTATGVGEGAHTFALTARDAAGHDSPTNTHAWTVDVTGALPVVDTKPAAVTSTTTAAFAVSSEAPDFHHFTCTVDGVPVDCSDGTVEVTVAPGAHQFRVVGHDDLGNGTAVTYDWVVDTAAPAATLLTKPAALTKATVATFTWAEEAGVSYACVLDGADVPCGDGSFTSAALAEGAHTFALTASDDAGNESEPATHTWTVDTTAPVVTVATPGPSITAARSVTFSEPVVGVSATTVRLLLTGTTTRVAVSLSCRDAAAAVVSCAAATVRRVVVTPITPLLPGQLHTLTVSGLTDGAGNAAATRSAAFRASTSEQESSAAAKAAWRTVALSAAQGGSYTVARLKGASATYAFTGTGIRWYAVRGRSFGTADVYVDGVLKLAKVNFYSTSAGSTYKSIGGLTNAKHTLEIVVRGEKGASAGTGTDVAVDAFLVGSTTVTKPAATYGWAVRGATAASGKAYALEDAAGSTYTFRFRGRGVDWVTVLGPTMGKARVAVDGVVKGTYDNWASATKYGVVRSFTGLADKVHTLTITVLGQRRSGATGSHVAVDRFGVRP